MPSLSSSRTICDLTDSRLNKVLRNAPIETRLGRKEARSVRGRHKPDAELGAIVLRLADAELREAEQKEDRDTKQLYYDNHPRYPAGPSLGFVM